MMSEKPVLLLIAGYPGSGKTALAQWICRQWTEFHLLSPDVFKEKFWNRKGFSNEQEKGRLERLAWQAYYYELELCMQQQRDVISEYPFSCKQYGHLQRLLQKYPYIPMTIRLKATEKTLFFRQQRRNQIPGRHAGHLASAWKPDGQAIFISKKDSQLNFEDFCHFCAQRGYADFSLGKLFEIDVNDFSHINYDSILAAIQKIKRPIVEK